MLELKIHLNQNLPEELFVAMKRCVEKCSSMPEHYLFSACNKHAKDAKEEATHNDKVDYESCQKLAESFNALRSDFGAYSEIVQIALKAAMYYFALDEDDEPDFDSLHGFDDDIIVANVCLKFASREDLTI